MKKDTLVTYKNYLDKLINHTSEERDITFIIVLDINRILFYKQSGKAGTIHSKLGVEDGSLASNNLNLTQILITNASEFLEEFLFIEFIINQILKVYLTPRFSLDHWEKLDLLVLNSYLNFESKLRLLRSFNLSKYEEISKEIRAAQILRNKMVHSPFDDYTYKDREIDYHELFNDLTHLNRSLISHYKQVQLPILRYLKRLK